MSFIHGYINLTYNAIIQRNIRLNLFSHRYYHSLRPSHQKNLFCIHPYHNNPSGNLLINFKDQNGIFANRQYSTFRSLDGDKNREFIIKVKKELQSMPVSKLLEFFSKMREENLSWKSLPESLRTEIKTKILIGRGKEIPISIISRFLMEFKSVDYEWTKEAEVRNAIFRKIRYALSQKDNETVRKRGKSVVHIIYYLGYAKIKKEMVPTEVLLGLLEAVKLSSRNYIYHERQICHLMYGLGEMGVKWKDIPVGVQEALESSLLSCVKSMMIIEVSGVMVGSVGMDYRWFASKEIRTALMGRIVELFRTEGKSGAIGREVANIIYGMGKGGMKTTDIPSEALRVVLEGIKSNTTSFTEQNVSNIIYGLGEMGVKWDDIPVDVQEALESSLLSRVKSMTVIDVSAVLTRSVGMDYRWYARSQIRTALMGRIVELFRTEGKSGAVDSRGVANIIYGMGKGGMKTTEITSEALRVVLEGIKSNATSFTEQEVSNVIYGLGEMGVKWKDIPVGVQEALESSLLSRVKSMMIIEVSGVLTRSVGMDYRWYARSQIRTALMGRIVELFRTEGKSGAVDSRGVANIIYGMGKGGMKTADIPSDALRALLDGIKSNATSFTEQEVSNVIYGLGEMGVKWKDIPVGVQEALESSLLSRVKSMMIIEVSGVLMGSVGMDYRWIENEKIRHEIFQKIIESFGGDVAGGNVQALCSIVLGMGSVGMKKDMLPKDVYAALINGVKFYRSSLHNSQLRMIAFGFDRMK